MGDVGDRRVEEVNVVERGGNYQWSFLEGSDPTRFPRPAQVRGREQGPLFTFTHQTSGSVIGGLVYRGRAFPELAGRYLFGDNGSGQVWSLPGQASAPAPVEPLVRLPIEMTVYAGLSSFAVDDLGEPYFCVLGDNDRGTGTVQKLVRAPRADRPAPATLSATGLFTDLGRLAPVAELFPYEVNAPFWSDHAEKARWLFVPPGTRVGFRAEGDWTFPPGTIAVKHFDLPIDEVDPTRRRRLETRVLVLDSSGGVYGRTYKWRPDGRDADLVTTPVIERLTRTARRPAGPWQLAALAGGATGSSTAGPAGRLQLESPPGGTAFAQVAEAGDFNLAASFSDVAGGSAGLMVRRGLTAEAPYVHAAWEPDRPRHLRLERRERAGGPVSVNHLEVAGGSWIRTQRARGALTVFAGEDGHLWQEVATFSEGEGTVQAGLAVRASAAGPARAVATAAIRCEVRDHLYPGAGDCAACHSASAGHVLGVSTRQWNREVPAAGARVNQLLLAQQRGLLDGPLDPARIASYRKLVSIDEPSASVEDRRPLVPGRELRAVPSARQRGAGRLRRPLRHALVEAGPRGRARPLAERHPRRRSDDPCQEPGPLAGVRLHGAPADAPHRESAGARAGPGPAAHLDSGPPRASRAGQRHDPARAAPASGAGRRDHPLTPRSRGHHPLHDRWQRAGPRHPPVRTAVPRAAGHDGSRRGFPEWLRAE